MNRERLLFAAMCFLGLALLICLCGIIALAWVGDRPIPDVLIAVTGSIAGSFGTLLVPGLTRDSISRQR